MGRNRFVRNILYAIGNSGDIKFKKTLFLLTNDYDPTVAEAALWAINEINANVN
jgi:epoxyqueuosine reductase